MSSRPLSRHSRRKGSTSKRAARPRLVLHGLRLQIDRQRVRRARPWPAGGARSPSSSGRRTGRSADLGAVVVEDVGEGRRDDRAEAVVLQGPGGVLAARSRSRSCGRRPGSARPAYAGGSARSRDWRPSSSKRQSKKRNSPKPVRSMRFRNCLGMIWSVSTLARSSGATTPATWRRRRSIRPPPRLPRGSNVADVDEVAGDGRGGGHLRADQVRAAALALAALEVAVGGRGAALARLQDVGVHPQAHRAAGLAPLEAGGA